MQKEMTTLARTALPTLDLSRMDAGPAERETFLAELRNEYA